MTSQIKESRTANMRAQIYLFLGAIFLKQPEEDMIRFLLAQENQEILRSLGCVLEFPEGKDSNVIMKELQAEYFELFQKPGVHLTPYASAWCDTKSGQWVDATTRVQQLLQELGLGIRKGWNGLPDHMGVLLELMGKLMVSESMAWNEKNENKATFFRECEKIILDNFLGWLPDFCRQVEQQKSLNFYRPLSSFLKKFIEEEQLHFEKLP